MHDPAQFQVRRTVIITGGTKGIGRAIAIKLAKRETNLVLNYCTDDVSAREALLMCERINSHVITIKADVSNRYAVESMIAESTERFGTLDVLINNAGLNIDKELHDLTEKDWDRVIDTNLKGVFLCSQSASRYMLQQETGGIILNVAASTGIRGRTHGINYCASKAGVIVMTKCLALELAPKVRVNCIIPGIVRTEETGRRFNLGDPKNLKAQEATIPLGRIGTPEEVADVVDFALSNAAQYITGQKLIVDGGQFMY